MSIYVLTCRWWEEYSDRKNDEEDEHVSDSLLYGALLLLRYAWQPATNHLDGPLCPKSIERRRACEAIRHGVPLRRNCRFF